MEKKPKIAIYGGMFDPPTLGHLDVIKRASVLFDKMIVVELKNPDKKPMFAREDRMKMMKAMLKDMPDIEVYQHDGLLTAFAHSVGANYSVRGIRNGFDADYERPMFEFNSEIAETEFDGYNLDTVFIPTTRKNFDTSSSNIRALIGGGAYKTAEKYLHADVLKIIKEKLGV